MNIAEGDRRPQQVGSHHEEQPLVVLRHRGEDCARAKIPVAHQNIQSLVRMIFLLQDKNVLDFGTELLGKEECKADDGA